VWLTDLRNLFARNLLSMDKDYITQIVVSSYRQSLVAFQNGTMVAGATFRLFAPHEFVELIFFWVDAALQSRGLGQQLMSHLKHHYQSLDLRHILVFGDHTALGSFERQGFSPRIDFDPRLWQDRVQAYAGSTLLYAPISDTIDYCHDAEWRFAVRQFVADKIPQLPRFRARGYPLQSLAGIKIPEVHEVPAPHVMAALFQKVRGHSISGFFAHSVSRESFPNYYEVIKRPMSLDVVEDKLPGSTMASKRSSATSS
jgi:N-acetylglutamate synthase-like GNAT family acetyltransferase